MIIFYFFYPLFLFMSSNRDFKHMKRNVHPLLLADHCNKIAGIVHHIHLLNAVLIIFAIMLRNLLHSSSLLCSLVYFRVFYKESFITLNFSQIAYECFSVHVSCKQINYNYLLTTFIPSLPQYLHH